MPDKGKCTVLVVFAVLCSPAVVLLAQPITANVLNVEPTHETATVTFFNRPIVVLRARVLGRSPAERALGAQRVLAELPDEGIFGQVEPKPFDGGVLLTVGSRGVVILVSADVDELSGETLERVTAQTVARLDQALREAAEARTPAVLLRAAAAAVAALLIGTFAVWGISRGHRAIANKLVALGERKVTESGVAALEAVRASRLLEFERSLVATIAAAIDGVVIYALVTFVLRRFPYTRPWGESMRGFLVTTAKTLGLGVVKALPGLFTAIVIFVIVHFAVRLVTLWFNAIERGHVRTRWIYPETAQPTRRLVSTLLWLFALVVAYPYLPGSESDAFKGVSVFLGVIVTFGSTGLVNQWMSSFMITYSRALRVGDFVRIGEVEGVVTQLGVLSVKVRTVRHEEVTIPNAVAVTNTTTNYSRPGDTEGVFTPTSVTIGYDAPWRQVEALLLAAAERTPGLHASPKPFVTQAALEDFYVKYTLLVCLERQDSRLPTLDALHANIQDLFNEYGVQIMSPHYQFDPVRPKIVRKQDWFGAPARKDSQVVENISGISHRRPVSAQKEEAVSDGD